MAVLVLRLAGPLQSWGVSSKFNIRESGTEPSKSGVIGMVAAALGRRRGDFIEDLAALRFGVRRDQPGTVTRDFHMAHVPPEAHTKESSFVTTRFYIEDAIFVAALEGDRELLEKADRALRSPAFPLFLGRRSCPPTGPVTLGVRDESLEDVLFCLEWQASRWYRDRCGDSVALETVIDSQNGSCETPDQPVSFDVHRRVHRRRTSVRSVNGTVVSNPHSCDVPGTSHDVLSALREED